MDSNFDMSIGYNLPQASGSSGAATLPEPDMAEVFFQKSFNSMLSELTSSVVSGDSDSDSSDSDPFAGMFDLGLAGITNSFNSASGVEQLMAINSGSALIGKNVEFSENNILKSGIVEKVVVEAGVPYLIVDGIKVPVSDDLSVMGG